jgi:hypothetical protein
MDHSLLQGRVAASFSFMMHPIPKDAPDWQRRRWSKAERRHWLAEQRRGDEALRKLNAAHPLVVKPTISRLLHVSNEYFTCAAVWERKDGFWRCIQAAPIIAWMKRTPIDRISIELLKRGCRWTWSPVMPGTSPQQVGLASASGKGFTNTAHEILTDRALAGSAGEGGDTGNGSPLSAVCVASSEAQPRGQ